MQIINSITPDGLVGYDEFNQLTCGRPEGSSMVYTFISDVRGKVCEICRHGWDLTSASMIDQTPWYLLDNGERKGQSIVHRSCLVRHGALCDRRTFYMALVKAKVRWKGFELLPNGYWPSSYPEVEAPWYRAELIDYPAAFLLGARKRVVEVQVVPTGRAKLDWWHLAELQFADADVTKHFRPDSVLLHAWDDDKVREYVAALAKLGGYDKDLRT